MTWVQTPEGRLRVGKIVCLIRNYRAHAEEFGEEPPAEPTYFLKPATAIVHDGERVVVPPIAADLEAEAELAVVIGRRMRAVPAGDAMPHVHGYAVFLDITARGLQREAGAAGLPWTLAKGMDTFAPVSDVRPREAVADPHALELTLRVNGDLRQRASTGDVIHRIPEALAAISARLTLERGDLVATGTPEGVPPIRPGDRLRAEVSGVGRLRVEVEAGG